MSLVKCKCLYYIKAKLILFFSSTSDNINSLHYLSSQQKLQQQMDTKVALDNNEIQLGDIDMGKLGL
jgi:hypothetical protein